MTAKAALIGVAAASAVLCVGGMALLPMAAAVGMGGNTNGGAGTPAALTGCGQPGVTLADARTPTVAGYRPAQVAVAATIVKVGQQLNVPPRGWVVAVATAMQESNLTNLGDLGARNDHDSLGVFQQRPSQGWGTPAQVMDPAYAARAFYQRLTAVDGWQSLPLTTAAQRVQRSAFPGAYAKHEPAAATLVDKVAGGAANVAAGAATAGTCAPAGQVAASGWVVPVAGPVVSGFRTPSRPSHNGVDLAAAKHTAVRAAAAGVVIKALCDPATAAVRSCNADGGMSVPGCGWYVDVRHAAGIISRYCHQIVAPLVHVGDTVTAGQQLGWSGTSGNSSGPHVHFEIHTNNDDRGSTGAIDPIPFMRDHGAPLGAQIGA